MKKFMVVIIVIVILCVTGVLTALGINHHVKSYATERIKENPTDLQQVDAVLILGCEVKEDGSLSLMLRDRLNKGIEVYRAGVATKMIVSGDNRSESNSETNAMKQYLMDNGVKEEDIIMDDAGFSTYDSMYRLKNTFQIDKCVVITQEYHLYRAIYIGGKLGVDSFGIASEGEDYAGQMARDFREFLARNKDFVKCIFKPQATYMEKELPKEE